MRYLAFYLALCCGLLAQSTKVGGSGTTKVGGSGTTKVSPVSAGITYLLNVQSSGSTAPGWTDTGTVNWNQATSLFGLTPSIRMPGAYDNHTQSPTFTSSADLYVRFSFLTEASASLLWYPIFIYSGATAVGSVSIRSDGRVNVTDEIGSNFAATTDALSPTIAYYIWIRITKGTGANGFLSVAFNTTNSEPVSGNAYASVSNGANITNLDNLILQCWESTATAGVFNDIKARDSAPIP